MGSRALLAMSLLLVAAPAMAAPITLEDADALGRWLQRSLRRAVKRRIVRGLRESCLPITKVWKVILRLLIAMSLEAI